ncbi:serine hydrolase domain-containing protein [Oceanibacterium hippocampi]|uniref:6-aminohexanoate-dimer hydrolase n=1 Tax=Oceanibacterium hippocampi TaxID=745714 RepID=A0A1Y5T0T5_9PROT|nr:serine hydrolase [Oceanibacterium hippocampi]SLN49476.1 6-aminohexanoate-dimer hydrolase [Oceanibacterium hippocampi]
MSGAFRIPVATALLPFALGTDTVHGEEPVLNGGLNAAFAAGELAGLHGIVVIHRGETLAEAFFEGADERWGEPLGNRTLDPDSLHDLRSVTKPIVGLLYGIALAEGKVPEVDQPLIAQFPEYTDLADQPGRRDILIRHALSMTMGTAWNEDLPYSDPRNSEIAMERAADRYRFVLDRPMVDAPGAAWRYNGGAVAIIGRLIADGTGMALDAYAREKLFRPLGITAFEWVKGADGVPSAASGLRLRIGDLARIGRMLNGNGRFDGRQVVPADWLERTFTPRATLGDGLRYGYLFWLAPWGQPPAWAAGFGNGGQRLTVQPAIDLTIVVFAGNYNDPDGWRLPVKLIEEHVVPAIEKRLGAQ